MPTASSLSHDGAPTGGDADPLGSRTVPACPTSSSGSTHCGTSRAPSADDGRTPLARRARAGVRADGFFARDNGIARVYVGYPASDALRRSAAPAPPEPCRRPELRTRTEPPSRTPAYEIGEWRATWTERDYADAVDAVRAAIAEGDVYQVNLVQHLSADFDGDPAALADALAALRPLEPDPLDGRLDDRLRVPGACSRAAGRAFARRRSRERARPACGRVGEGRGGARDDRRSRAERSRGVARAGSVRWPELLAERELAGVTHLVATVEAELRDGVGLTELLEAVLPGGSVTGCPKIAALDVIAALEPVGRGASMGALGRIYSNGDLDLALTIRTFAIADGAIHLWVGGGIVWDSDPAEEVEESWVKARPLLARSAHRRGPRRVTLAALAVVGRGVVPVERLAACGRRGALPWPLGVRDAARVLRRAVQARRPSRSTRAVGGAHSSAAAAACGARLHRARGDSPRARSPTRRRGCSGSPGVSPAGTDRAPLVSTLPPDLDAQRLAARPQAARPLCVEIGRKRRDEREARSARRHARVRRSRATAASHRAARPRVDRLSRDRGELARGGGGRRIRSADSASRSRCSSSLNGAPAYTRSVSNTERPRSTPSSSACSTACRRARRRGRARRARASVTRPVPRAARRSPRAAGGP